MDRAACLFAVLSVVVPAAGYRCRGHCHRQARSLPIDGQTDRKPLGVGDAQGCLVVMRACDVGVFVVRWLCWVWCVDWLGAVVTTLPYDCTEISTARCVPPNLVKPRLCSVAAPLAFQALSLGEEKVCTTAVLLHRQHVDTRSV